MSSQLQASNEKQLERLSAMSENEGLWGRVPGRVLATGLSEDKREHQARLRRYLIYYLQLLARTAEADTLYSATCFLRKSQTAYPGLMDVFRCCSRQVREVSDPLF